MSQALHTASTGINAGQSQINVIAHNVANINTVAYKSANMTFETLHSHNLSYGSAATKDGGGTNPKQIGLGVKISGITRNFDTGTFVATGRDLDTMISGTGFFVVQDADKHPYFTRDGVFNIDSEGNLVTQNGMKVMGAKSIYSNAGSDKTVKIPKNMLAKVEGDSDISSRKIKDLNNASITSGKVAVDVSHEVEEEYEEEEEYQARIEDENGDPILDDDGNEQFETRTRTVTKTRTVTETETVYVDIPDGNETVGTIVSNFNSKLSDYDITFKAENGQISYEVRGDYTMKFSSDGTTSNFLGETGLGNKTTSNILSEKVTLQDMINYNDKNAISLKTTAIDENGILVATYSDGSILTQYVDEAETLQWKYTTSEGVTILGSDVNAEGSAIRESNFALELATMVNQEGLISLNNNLWQWGPDVGDIFYGVAGEMAFGSIESGGYEESNVDIAHELSNMISAQRMIQMNSRVFSTASEVMQQLAYLGQ